MSAVSFFRSQYSPENSIGKEARFISRQRHLISEKQQEDSASSIIGFLKDEILEIFFECSLEDWDGYNAQHISKKTVHEAFKFIELLPLYVNKPEVLPEPTGDIGLLWRKSKAQLLSLTITPQGVVSYVYILGKNEGYGHIQFFDEIPEMITKLLQRVQDS
jgi:hypothetical protein